MRLRVLTATLVVAVVAAPVALASVGVATNAASPKLLVDSSGAAEVSWTAGGSRRSFVVPTHGLGHYGTIAGDVSKATHLALPMAIAVRKTSNGTRYALQRVAITGRPASLDLARWTGAPTSLTLVDDATHLTGTATFHGKPVTGSSTSLTGKHVRIYVYLECFGCSAAPNGWSLMVGVPPKADGSFSVGIRSSWVGKRYRATVLGPNVGGQLAPDARATIDATP